MVIQSAIAQTWAAPCLEVALCQSCDKCLAGAVCKSRAILQLDTGWLRLVDAGRSLGCTHCIPVCPLGAIRLNHWSKTEQEGREMSKEPLHVTDASFEREVLESDLPVLVDFWAPWCGPCLMVAPVIKELAADFDGRLLVAKLNTDENNETAARYGIMSIPTMIVFKDGQEAERMIGARPKQALIEKLESFLGPAG